MSMEDSPTQNIDENQLLKEDETELSTADAVSLFNASLSAALERQKTEILSEFQKTSPVTSPVNADISVNAQSSNNKSLGAGMVTVLTNRVGDAILLCVIGLLCRDGN